MHMAEPTNQKKTILAIIKFTIAALICAILFMVGILSSQKRIYDSENKAKSNSEAHEKSSGIIQDEESPRKLYSKVEDFLVNVINKINIKCPKNEEETGSTKEPEIKTKRLVINIIQSPRRDKHVDTKA